MAMVAKFKLILAGIGAVLLLLITAFFKGRSSGVAETESKVQDIKDEVKASHTAAVEEVAQTRVENVKVANRVKQDVIKSSDKQVDKELNDEWTRG